MFCQNCGTEINDGAKFCSNCGTTVGSAQTSDKQNQKIPERARLSHHGSVGVYEFLETLEPDLDFIWVQSDNAVKANLLGIAGIGMTKTYILAFNSKNIYVCELSNLSGKDIVNISKYAWNEISSFTTSGAIVGKSLKFNTKDGERKFRTQKIFGMENQEDRIKKLLLLQK